MNVFAALALALAFLAEGAVLPGVAPSNSSATKGETFTLTQVRNQKFRGHDASIAFMKAHLKYAPALPSQLSNAIKVNSQLKAKFVAITKSSMPDLACRPSLVRPHVLLTSRGRRWANGVGPGGTIARRRLRIHDTGADRDAGAVDTVKLGHGIVRLANVTCAVVVGSWTFSTDTYGPSVRGQWIYKPQRSTTSKLRVGESWQVRYADGASASGIVYQDTVRVGATSVSRQVVQAAVQVSDDIAADVFSSGILGMANNGINTVRPNPARTYFDNVKDKLAKPLFTADLHRQRVGSYNFGYIDAKAHTGGIQYAKIDRHSPFWKVAVSGFQVGSRAGKYQNFGFKAIVDTGTSLLLLPQNVVDEYYDAVDGAGMDRKQGMMVFPCKARAPDFVFGIGGYRGVVPGDFMKYANVNSTHCFGGIQTSGNIGFSVFGDILIKAQFVVFDQGNMQVGFANKNAA
ncbi:hypothetical protein DCS_03470 [Drechmeria coniospora]|uniref:Peptidase A1 domain-containing protein n=1 Tax=Drechmeria coniospora TaxID=98403 RepID=A0A151GHB3_DRECN|nr:hypothetical protein DCS_03470 [Drechmeria coniospora]KYK56470.1 hypothetical protein DCS_03470 [Drechmeria coniospora]